MNETDQIRKQMADIRLSMHKDIAGVVQDAETFLDWRSYIRNAPWISMGAAFAVGYLIVPRRSRTEPRAVAVDPPPPAYSLVGGSARPPEKPRKRFSTWGLLGTAVSFAMPVAIRAAQSYAVARLEEMLASGNMPFVPGGQSGAAGPGPARPAGAVPPWAAGAAPGAGAGRNRPI